MAAKYCIKALNTSLRKLSQLLSNRLNFRSVLLHSFHNRQTQMKEDLSERTETLLLLYLLIAILSTSWQTNKPWNEISVVCKPWYNVERNKYTCSIKM